MNALGRSRGGYGTKAVVACDARGRALGFVVLPGQASELKAAPELLVRVRELGRIGLVICDRGYSSAAWRTAICTVGAKPVVPPHPTHAPVGYDKAAYRRRSRVERLWGRLKEWRAVATRYEKTASAFLGALHVAAIADWIKHGFSYTP